MVFYELLDEFNRQRANHGKRGNQFRQLAAGGLYQQLGLDALRILAEGAHVQLRLSIMARDCTFPHLNGNIREDVRDGGPARALRGRNQFLPDLVGREYEKLAEEIGRNVRSSADRLRKALVALRTHDELPQACIGEAGAGISRQSVCDLGIAKFDKDVRDRFIDRGTGRDLVQVPLAFVFRKLDEIVVGQPVGFRKNGAGNLDGVVPRKAPDDPGGRIRNRRKPPAQLRKCLALDFAGKPADDVIEDRNLLRSNVLCIVDEKVCNAM